MARAGLGPTWKCLFANDFDPHKAYSYRENWKPTDELVVKDIAEVASAQLPGQADLAWASFPCQDLSLAGDYAGLAGERSGTFWAFWNLIRDLRKEGRGPKTISVENVCGTLTSHRGQDFKSIARAFADENYCFGAMTIDARQWVPQSRPRLFIVAVRDDIIVPNHLIGGPSPLWHSATLRKAQEALPKNIRSSWIWWNMPTPPNRTTTLAKLIEEDPTGTDWHSKTETDHILSLMSEVNLAKVEEAKRLSRQGKSKLVGGVYRRTRDGRQRAEVRFDGVAGCLRTPAGGSSRQTILVIENGRVRSRLLSTREAARLMGLPDTYALPSRYNQAYHLLGDGVVVPCVTHIATHLLGPLLEQQNFADAAE